MNTRAIGLIAAGLMSLGAAGVVVFAVFRSSSGSGPTREDVAKSMGELSVADPDSAPVVGQTSNVLDFIEASEEGRVPLYTEDGRLAQMLFFERFEPLESGRFRVERPRALIYLGEGQTAEIRAERAEFSRRQSQREPEAGWFRGEVEVRLYEERVPESGEPTEDAAITMRTESVEFDTVVGEIRMPEHVRVESRRVEFEGSGFSAIFSQKDRRLLFMRLEKGDRLTFREDRSDAARAAADGGGSAPAHTAGDGREDLYRVEFGGPVSVLSDGRKMEAERLELWARLIDGELRPEAIAEVGMRPGAPHDPEAPIGPEAPAGLGTPAPPTGAALVTMTWDGPMEARPLAAPPLELAADDLFARFSAPTSGRVSLVDEALGASGECTTVEYGATRGTIALASPGSRGVTARLKDRAEAIVGRIEIDLREGVVSIPGAGESRAIGAGVASELRDETGQAPARDIAWQGRCDLTFDETSEGATLRRAAFTDGVLARSEAGRASGEYLGVEFARVAPGRLEVARVVIEDSAHVDAGANGAVDADRIEVVFEPLESGSGAWPRVATGSGRVRAQRGDAAIGAELVEATFVREDGQTLVETFNADVGVVVKIGEGARAITARTERLRTRPREQLAELTGEESVIERAGGALRAASMRLEGEARRLTVFGPGTAEQRASSPGGVLGYDHARIEWARSMMFDDSAGRVEFSGDVVTIAEVGETATDAARGERLVVEFTPGSAEGMETAPDGPKGEQRVTRATLVGLSADVEGGKDAELESRRHIPDPTSETGRRLETLVYLSGENIVASAADETLTVPMKGRLLVEDRRENQDVGRAGPLPSGARGTTLFDWEGAFTLNRRTGRAEMERRVRLVQRPPGAEEVAEMECETLEAIFSEVEGRLVRAEAREGVFVRKGLRHVVADMLLYDALSGLATISAWEGNVVTFHDGERGATQEAGAIEWDLVSDRVTATRVGPISLPR